MAVSRGSMRSTKSPVAERIAPRFVVAVLELERKTPCQVLRQNRSPEMIVERLLVKDLDSEGSLDLRVPFGLQVQTGELVDVADVPRGLASGCICPSCKVPLQAKQGEINRWYFAHETRGTYKQAADQCELSIWTAMVLLARQELSRATMFKTPTYELFQAGMGQLVTESRDLVIAHCEIEKQQAGMRWDAVVSVQNVQMAIMLSHPEKRFVLQNVEDVRAEKLGIVSVDLQVIWTQVNRQHSRESSSRRSAFRQALLEGVAGKRWEYHPREERIREDLARRAAAAPGPRMDAQAVRADRSYGAAPPQGGVGDAQGTRVRCMMCRAVWLHVRHGKEPCPGCGAKQSWIPEQ